MVEGGRDVELKDGIGNYRVDKVPEEYFVSKPFENSYHFKLERLEWQQFDESNKDNYSRLITGLAGTGKTFSMRKDLSHLGRYVLLATTHAAAELLGGETVHHYFQIDRKGKYDQHGAILKASKLDYVIIDEIGLAQANLYEILHFIKCNSKVRFILLGDYRQLGPVKDTNDYSNSTVLKELVEGKIQRLTKNHRCPPDLFELFDKVEELNPNDFSQNNTKIHICKTNAKRIAINEEMMAKDKKKKRAMLKIAKHEEDPNSQDVALIQGTPVMALISRLNLCLIEYSL